MSLARYEKLLPSYLKMLDIVGAETVEQCAMIAAQIGWESGGLYYQQEVWGPTAAQRSYDGRMDNRPGTDDWSRYRGHGWIQVTGRYNHTQCSLWAHRNGVTGDPYDFVNHPEQLGWDEYCWVGPSWYFTEARAGFMDAARRGDVKECTRMINGGYNHLAERERWYREALQFGEALLPPGKRGGQSVAVEKVLEYSRDQIRQDTFYNCGPASVQTVVWAATGSLRGEDLYGRELKTHTGGTDWVGQFPAVLNRYIPDGKYTYAEMPSDPPTETQRGALWDRVKSSIDAGYGVIANIVAPSGNYPRASYKSTISPTYGGGTVYHYFAVMGYAIDGAGVKHVWVADSGFSPYGYWMTFNQLATLIPPKGYAYSQARPVREEEKTLMALSEEQSLELLTKVREIHHELKHKFQTRVRDENGELGQFRDTMIGYILEGDKKDEDMHKNMLPAIYEKLLEIESRLNKEGKK